MVHTILRTAAEFEKLVQKLLLDGSKIVSETTNGNIKWYIYDENNSIIGYEYFF